MKKEITELKKNTMKNNTHEAKTINNNTQNADNTK